jgi:hypothetical protein
MNNRIPDQKEFKKQYRNYLNKTGGKAYVIDEDELSLLYRIYSDCCMKTIYHCPVCAHREEEYFVCKHIDFSVAAKKLRIYEYWEEIFHTYLSNCFKLDIQFLDGSHVMELEHRRHTIKQALWFLIKHYSSSYDKIVCIKIKTFESRWGEENLFQKYLDKNNIHYNTTFVLDDEYYKQIDKRRKIRLDLEKRAIKTEREENKILKSIPNIVHRLKFFI